jgi:hypothetical protein
MALKTTSIGGAIKKIADRVFNKKNKGKSRKE